MNRDTVISEVHRIWAQANKLFSLKIKSVPEIGFFSKTRYAGKAWFMEHKVEFNEILAIENPDTFATTIAHELAHLITHQLYPNAKQAHGPEFRHVMETLGYDGRTYHSYDVSSVSTKRVKSRFVYECLTCVKTYEVAKPTHTKMQASVINDTVVGWKCKCGSHIKFTGEEKRIV